MKETVIRACNTRWWGDFGEMVAFRYVLFMLTLRDIKLRYKQTLLGVVWVALQPLLSAAVLTGIFGKGLNVPHEGHSYLLFTFAALIPWIIFSRSLERACPSISSDSRLITKVYFPRLFIPLSATFGVAIDYFIIIFLGWGLCLIEGLSLTRALIGFPLATLHLFLFCAAINTCAAALNVYFRDLKHILPFIIQLSMIISPIAYPISVIPKSFVHWYQLNPLVGIIEFYRFLFLGTHFPYMSWTISALETLLLSLGALFLFHKIERHFADVI